MITSSVTRAGRIPGTLPWPSAGCEPPTVIQTADTLSYPDPKTYTEIGPNLNEGAAKRRSARERAGGVAYSWRDNWVGGVRA